MGGEEKRETGSNGEQRQGTESQRREAARKRRKTVSGCEERRRTGETTKEASSRKEKRLEKTQRKTDSSELLSRPEIGEKLDSTPGKKWSLVEETEDAVSNRSRRDRKRSLGDAIPQKVCLK